MNDEKKYEFAISKSLYTVDSAVLPAETIQYENFKYFLSESDTRAAIMEFLRDYKPFGIHWENHSKGDLRVFNFGIEFSYINILGKTKTHRVKHVIMCEGDDIGSIFYECMNDTINDRVEKIDTALRTSLNTQTLK